MPLKVPFLGGKQNALMRSASLLSKRNFPRFPHEGFKFRYGVRQPYQAYLRQTFISVTHSICAFSFQICALNILGCLDCGLCLLFSAVSLLWSQPDNHSEQMLEGSCLRASEARAPRTQVRKNTSVVPASEALHLASSLNFIGFEQFVLLQKQHQYFFCHNIRRSSCKCLWYFLSFAYCFSTFSQPQCIVLTFFT